MSVWKWLATAASNANVDATINLREGQSPGSLNNAARAMMAAIAKYRDDVSGVIVTGGGDTAYTVTSNQAFGSLASGRMVAFTPHATNGANPTLNVDSLGAKPLRGVAGQELPAGTLLAGTPYVARYSADNSGEWILHGYMNNPASVPIGVPLPFTGTVLPNSSFAWANGQAISRSTYETYFGMVGTTFGVGNGTTTFNIINLQNRGIFGMDAMGGAAASNLITTEGSGIDGNTLGAVGGEETHELTGDENGPHTHDDGSLATSIAGSHSHPINTSSGTNNSGPGISGNDNNTNGAQNTGAVVTAGDHTHNITGSTGSSGSGAPHNNMPPVIILPFIIRII